jgi:enoyl reductase-like protein
VTSALPKQVQKQLAEIAEMEKAMMAPAPVDSTDVGENTQTESPQQSEAPVATEQVTSTETPAPQAEEKWEQKYRILQGKYDAEVPRLHQQNKELATQLQTLQAQVTELAKPKEAPKQEERLVTEADEEAFGKDLLDVQRRIAREIMREHVAPLQGELSKRDARIEQLENMLTRTQGDVTSMTFEQQLERVVPDFSKINADPKWVAWLDAVDSNGDSIRPRAEAAYNAGDIGKVAKYVEAFKATLAPVRKNESNQQELRQQVAPPKTATPQSNVPQGERVYTEAEANRLWDKVTKLYTQGKNDEGLSLENELSAAYAQGRIRP